MGEGDLEKVEGDAPVGIVGLRGERFEPSPIDALDDHVVDQRGEVARERIGLSRGRGDERRLARIEDEPVGPCAADRPAQGPAPGANEDGERVAAGELADRGREPGARRLFARRLEKRRRLVGFEGAERSDSRQENALAAARREQRLGQA